MSMIYSYQERGRRPITYVAAAVFCFVFGAGVYHGAPWYFCLPVVLGGAMIFYLLVKNPISGLIVQPDALVLSPWERPKSIRLAEIEKVEIVSWSDSTDMNVHLKSGETIQAFAGDIPPTEPFRAALAEVGIPLEQS